jgi:hypothetical protein
MTLAELEHTLPNGFHDSDLLGIDIRIDEARVVLRMEIDFSDPDEEDGLFREAEIVLDGLQSVVLEGPSRGFQLDEAPKVDGFTPTEKQYPGLPGLPEEVRKNVHSLYLSGDWNSFLHLAARSASVSWKDEVRSRTERRRR